MVGRPPKKRKVNFKPKAVYFKPRAIPLSEIEEVELRMDEMEAVRLCDLNNISQSEAAKKMEISQSTLQRILEKAREKIAEGLVRGKALRINKE